MNLISLSIRRPVFAWILMSALIIFGAICANRLGVSQLPDIDFPILSISVTYEGASPEVVESASEGAESKSQPTATSACSGWLIVTFERSR